MKPFANHCLDRLGYGPRTGAGQNDIALFNQMGANDDQRLQAWVEYQLNWAAIPDSDLNSRIAAGGFTTLNKTLVQM